LNALAEIYIAAIFSSFLSSAKHKIEKHFACKHKTANFPFFFSSYRGIEFLLQ